MKKLSKIIIICLSAFLLTACGASNSSTKTPAEPEKEYADPVGPDVMKDKYVDAVLRMEPGSAGSSLKEAKVACEVLQFAADHNFVNMDRDQTAADLQSALDGLGEEDRKTFAENEKRVNEVILQSTSAEDFGEFKGVYEDAGVYDDMVTVAGNETALGSWQVLHDITAQVVGQ